LSKDVPRNIIAFSTM